METAVHCPVKRKGIAALSMHCLAKRKRKSEKA
jgi:hypothetical protein